MLKLFKSFLLLLFVLFGYLTVQSQTQKPNAVLIKGEVSSSTGEPLIGANISIKGKDKGTTTDRGGNFSIEASTGEKLVISMIGYELQEVTVAGQSSFKIGLKLAVKENDQVVVIGYGTQRKDNLTTSISSIKSDQIALIPTSNLSNVLAGRLSGVYVQSPTGTPGVASNIRIRSNSSWNASDVIYVIDGVVRTQESFNALNPSEVAEISVLKDAASAAIYGSRSSNGVILVTTKSGKSGRPSINFGSIFSTSKPAKLPLMMNTKDANALNNTVGTYATPAEFDAAYKWNPDGMAWWNAAYEKPHNQTYNLSVSGGTEKVTYFIGGSYYKEKGIFSNTNYQKYNLRANTTIKITKDLTAGLNLSMINGQREIYQWAYDNKNSINDSWIKFLYFGGFTPPYIDGKPVNPGWNNIIEQQRNGGYGKIGTQFMDALINLEYKVPFVTGLTAKAILSTNNQNTNSKNYQKKVTLYNFATSGPNNLIYSDSVVGTTLNPEPGQESLSYGNSGLKNYQFNTQLNYDRKFGDHVLNVLAVYEQAEGKSVNTSLTRYNFPLVATDQLFAASSDPANWRNSGSEDFSDRISYIGRINYSYKDRYLLSASVRGDGSLRFAPDKRWGWFPSVSAAWKLSDEPFFKASVLNKTIDFIKLRADFGSTGNDLIGGWQWLEQYNIGGGYFMGTPATNALGLTYGGIVNPNITWEKSKSYNAGFDMRFLHNFSLSTDLWFRHTYDILGSRIVALPVEFGGSLPAANYGVVDSKGYEIELGYNVSIGKDWGIFARANFSYATNKVKVIDVAANSLQVDNPIGRPLGYTTGYQYTDLYRTQADIAKTPAGFTLFGQKPELGMVGLADIAGPNGGPDGIVDSYDRIVLANYTLSNAPYSFGLNLGGQWKNFSLDVLFSGLAGFKQFYDDPFGRGVGNWYYSHFAYWNDSWSEDNVNGSKPKPFPWGDPRAVYEKGNSAVNMFNGSFVRLKNVNLSYALQSAGLQKAGIKNMQFFVSATNLFVISGFKYWDPELPSMNNYPLNKTYTVGLNVNF